MLTLMMVALLAAAPSPPAKKTKKAPADWMTIAPASSKPKKKEPPKQPPPQQQQPAIKQPEKQQPPPVKQQPPPVKQQPPAVNPQPQVAPQQQAAASNRSGPNLVMQLAEAKALFEQLEYDRVVPIATAILAREDANIEQRLDAYMLQGSSLAIIGDSVEAEKPFRFLLRGRPDFEMTPETSPKILAVFRKVQVEEKAIAAQMRELERARMVKALQLGGEHPTRAEGGRELGFEYSLRDPFAVVEELKVSYRRRGEPSYSTLALKRDNVGMWRAALPPSWTASDSGFVLEYYLTTADARGTPLLTVATAQQPMTASVEAGTVEEGEELYEKPWFWVAAGATVVLSGVAGLVIYERGNRLPESDLGVIVIDQ